MKNPWWPIAIMLISIQSVGCKKDGAETENKECLINIDTIDFTFGIDYTKPEEYLLPGEQSNLDQSYLNEIRETIGDPEDSIGYILEICQWVNEQFSFENAGGAMIGKITVNELFESRIFYGCHSQALIISSVIRELGFPAIMIETADVQWAYIYHSGKADYFAGHVMSEIFVENNWILLNNNGNWVGNYDPMNPFIPQLNYPPEAYFVFAKGIDTWGYSNKDESFTWDNLIFFAENIYCFEEMFHADEYSWNH